MEARLTRAALLAAVLFSLGARHKTPNFVVTASTPQIAQQVGQAAEKFRKELAIDWLGKELPNWAEPCPITVKTGPRMGAGGATSFLFDRGEVYGWRMDIQGSLERVLDSVLPHEVTHTIFASHFRQPLPRWADEGACTTVEHVSERHKQEQMLIQFLRTGRGIPFSRMFVMKEYPSDVMPLYSQGYSLARYLINHGGKKKYLDFLADGLKNEDWVAVTREHYGFANLGVLQNSWLDWVRQGSPMDVPLNPGEAATSLASHRRRPRPEPNLIYRAQSEDPPAAALVPVERPAARPSPPANTGAAAAPQHVTPSAPTSRWQSAADDEAGLLETNPLRGEIAARGDAKDELPSDVDQVVNDEGVRTKGQSGQVLLEWHRDRQALHFDAGLARGVMWR